MYCNLRRGGGAVVTSWLALSSIVVIADEREILPSPPDLPVDSGLVVFDATTPLASAVASSSAATASIDCGRFASLLCSARYTTPIPPSPIHDRTR